MSDERRNQVFLAYAPENRDAVEALACRLQGDARLSFWFAPWHSIPGVPIQEQMEAALAAAQSCAVFLGGSAGGLAGWQNEQVRAAIQRRVEDQSGYRIIPVLLPDAGFDRRSLPLFLRRYELVEFRHAHDEQAFKRLLAGILGVAPFQLDGYIEAQTTSARLPTPTLGGFKPGHALLIGIANYPQISPLPETVLADARDMHAVLIDPATCGYLPANVTLLLDGSATVDGIRSAMSRLAEQAGPDDTVIVFFSGHGARETSASATRQYILPYDCDLGHLRETALDGEEVTELLRTIRAGRLLILFDSCHSAGVGEPKAGLAAKPGLDEQYYEMLAQGSGRVVIASSRTDEVSWTLSGMRNSLFTHYLLEALQGQARTLGDGYLRVFDLFRHVADRVPLRANQHPVFKATAMERDFVLALARIV
jgi:metacaspase-1